MAPWSRKSCSLQPEGDWNTSRTGYGRFGKHKKHFKKKSTVTEHGSKVKSIWHRTKLDIPTPAIHAGVPRQLGTSMPVSQPVTENKPDARPLGYTASIAFGVTELLELMLLRLPIEDIFIVRRVCRQWSLCIRDSRMIRERAFLCQWERGLPEKVQHDGLWTLPVLLNPLLERTILLPAPMPASGKCFGNFAHAAVLLPRRSAEWDDKEQLRIPGTFPAERENRAATYGIHENLLDIAPAQTPSGKAPEQSPSGPRSHRGSVAESTTRPILVDASERPLHDIFRDDVVLSPRIIDVSKLPPAQPGHQQWKSMLLAQPEISDITVRRPDSNVAMHYWKSEGLLLTDLLDALEDLRNEWPGKWPRGERAEEPVEFEISLPLLREGGELARNAHGNVIWRALRTRVKCRLSPEAAEAGGSSP